MSDDEINYPTGFSLKDIVSWGNSCMIYLDDASQIIIKTPHGEENRDDIAIEKRIHERFSERGGHEGLFHSHGPYESRIRLAFACNGNLRSFLRNRIHAKDTGVNNERRLLWAAQIPNALRFVRSTNVVHGDVICGNVLSDE